MKQAVIKAGVTYFSIVFAAGFVLGIIRQLWGVPLLGTRLAELLEMPFMLAIIVLAARWAVLHFRIPMSLPARLTIGLVALFCLLATEAGLVLGLHQTGIVEYIAGRDPVSGLAYLAMLIGYTLMPLFVARHA